MFKFQTAEEREEALIQGFVEILPKLTDAEKNVLITAGEDMVRMKMKQIGQKNHV